MVVRWRRWRGGDVFAPRRGRHARGHITGACSPHRHRRQCCAVAVLAGRTPHPHGRWRMALVAGRPTRIGRRCSRHGKGRRHRVGQGVEVLHHMPRRAHCGGCSRPAPKDRRKHRTSHHRRDPSQVPASTPSACPPAVAARARATPTGGIEQSKQALATSSNCKMQET
jgi:hypothetical protein